MNRADIESAKSEMLRAVSERPADGSFAALSRRAEINLDTSIKDARVVVQAAAEASGGCAKLTSPADDSVPALEDAVFLRWGLDQAKDMSLA